MHRDVKPHNVMIDHEHRKVCLEIRHVELEFILSTSFDLLIGGWQNSTIQRLSTMFALRHGTSRDQSCL